MVVNNEVVYGYPNAIHYTRPDRNVRPAVFDNEDFGFTAQIAADDAYEFALPNPSDIDLDNEVMVLHWFEVIGLRDDAIDLNGNLTVEALDMFLSMFNIDFDTVNPISILDDVNSLELKKSFMGPMHLRLEQALLEDDSGTPASHFIVNTDDISWGGKSFKVVPFEPLRLFLPLYIQLQNQSKTFTTLDLLTAATNAAFAAASTEFFAIRVWYTRSRLTSSERNVLDAFKLLRLTA